MTETDQKPMIFDFRMDTSSWLTILAMVLIFAFMFIPMQIGAASGGAEILKNIGLGAVITFLLTAIACIPVIIYCWFIKMIPDIDYSVIVAAIVTIIAMVGLLMN